MLKRLFCFFIFATSALFADETIPNVSRIEILPQNLPASVTFNPNSVMATLQTKVGTPFSQIEFDNDLKNLAKEYDRVEPIIARQAEGVSITLKIWLKAKIRSIQFQGNTKIDSSSLEEEMGLKVGETFERDKFMTAFNKVKTYYIKKGYFETDFNYDIAENSPGEVDLTICIDEGRAGYVLKVIFEGLTCCEEDELRDLMATKKFITFLSWYSGRGSYHPEMIEHDRAQILSYFQNKGYADATVDIHIIEPGVKNRIVVQVCVDKGPLYTLGHICFKGNSVFTDEEICSCFQIYMGGPYSPECIRNTVTNIRDKYGACGYIDANCDVEMRLHENEPVYDLILSIEEGKKYCVGMIHVFGNKTTETRVILNETLLCPGEVFNTRKIDGTEKRLSNTGFFKRVNVYAVKCASDENLCRDVFIEVEEQDTGNLGIFFGFNSLQSIFGGVEVTERNFNAFGISDVLACGPGALRGAGEYLHFKADIGKRQTAYLLQWTIPYILDRPWLLGFDLEKTNNRMLSRGYELETYGGDVHATYLSNSYLKFDNYYRARHSSTDVTDKNNPLLDAEANIYGFISALGTTMIYDSTDSPRRPTNGFRSRALFEVAGLWGNFDFLKMGYNNTYYYPLIKKGVLKLKADINFIHTYGDTRPATLPMSERFFLGGDCTVRGYRPFIIGPLFGNNEPRGGVSSYLLSEEFQYNILDCPCIDGFVFMDSGYVSLSEFTVGRPSTSVGFGVRMEVMRNMPLTFGFGFPIHPYATRVAPDGTEFRFNTAQRFFFSFGGNF